MGTKKRTRSTVAVRNQHVISGVPMAKRIAAKHINRCSVRSVVADDLRSAAYEGLVKAADRFDATKGASFSTYAYSRITGEVLDFLREHDHVSKYYRAKAKTNDTLELPDAPLSIEEMDGADDRLPDARAVDPAQQVERRETQRVLEEAAQTLPEHLQRVLSLYYAEELTHIKIGTILGVTESRACQLLQEAHKRLRRVLEQNVTVQAVVAGRRPKRRYGTGTIVAAGKGFRWRIMRGSKRVVSALYSTYEEAEAALDRANAEHARPKRGRRRCGKCGAPGHYAPYCPHEKSS